MKISKGDVITIGKGRYDVLNVIIQHDNYDFQKDEAAGKHTSIKLHKFGDSTLRPTHLLKIYKDNPKEAILFRIVQEEAPKWLEKPRERGGIFNFVDKRKIPIEQIKLESPA